MTVLTFAKAINEALRYEMRRDERSWSWVRT
jgi:pyruvate/2-oxoglutarate/acetoin dehydrogenase E1 component